MDVVASDLWRSLGVDHFGFEKAIHVAFSNSFQQLMIAIASNLRTQHEMTKRNGEDVERIGDDCRNLVTMSERMSKELLSIQKQVVENDKFTSAALSDLRKMIRVQGDDLLLKFVPVERKLQHLEEGLKEVQEGGPGLAAVQDALASIQAQIDDLAARGVGATPLEGAPSEGSATGRPARPGSAASQRPGSAGSAAQGDRLGSAAVRATIRRTPSSLASMGPPVTLPPGPVDPEAKSFQEAVDRAVARALIARRGEDSREREALAVRVEELAGEVSLLKAKAARGRLVEEPPVKESESPIASPKGQRPPNGATSGDEGGEKKGKKPTTAFAKAAAERRAAEEERMRQIQQKTEQEIEGMQREVRKLKLRLDEAEDALDKANAKAEAANRRATATPALDEFRSARDMVNLHDDELKEIRRSVDQLRRDKAAAKDMEAGLKALNDRFDQSPLAAFPAFAPRKAASHSAGAAAGGPVVGGVTDEERDTVVDVTARRSVEDLRRFLTQEMQRAEKMVKALDRKLETKADRLAHEALQARADGLAAGAAEAGDRLARLEAMPALQPREAILTDAQIAMALEELNRRFHRLQASKADAADMDRALTTKIDVAAMDRMAREVETLRQSHIQFASKVEQENISSIRFAVEFKADRSDLLALEKRLSAVALGSKGLAGPRCLSCDRVVSQSYGTLEGSNLAAPRPPSPPPGGLAPVLPPPPLPPGTMQGPPASRGKGKPWEQLAEGAPPPIVGSAGGPSPAATPKGGSKGGRLGVSASTPELPPSGSRPGSAAQLAAQQLAAADAARRADKFGPAGAPNPTQRLDLPPSTVALNPEAGPRGPGPPA